MDPSKLPLEEESDDADLTGNGPVEPDAEAPRAEASAGADAD
jgi:hypothetical protein